MTPSVFQLMDQGAPLEARQGVISKATQGGLSLRCHSPQSQLSLNGLIPRLLTRREGDSGAIWEALHPALPSVNILSLIGEEEEGPRWSAGSGARYSQRGRLG